MAGVSIEACEGTCLSSQYVHVVDDDREVRRSLSFMLGSAQFQSRPFASGSDLVESLEELQPGCVLLDIRMPDMDGFQVMAELASRGIDWPGVVMTGHGEVPVAVRAMKAGAVDFLEKPFEEDVLLGSLERAFGLLKERGQKAERRRSAESRIGVLTSREREVLRHHVRISARIPAKRDALRHCKIDNTTRRSSFRQRAQCGVHVRVARTFRIHVHERA